MYRRFNRNYKKIRTIFFIILCLILCICHIENQVVPMLEDITVNRAKEMATNSINSAVFRVLENNGFKYENLININYGENNSISAVETNALNINKLKSEITLEIQKEISIIKDYPVKIPLFALIGLELLKNTGPEIPSEINLTGSVTTNFSSKLEASGINQTLHTIILNISADISVVSTGINTKTKVETDFIIAQTVIVGKIPETYLFGGLKNILN